MTSPKPRPRLTTVEPASCDSHDSYPTLDAMDRAHMQKSVRFGQCELQPQERRLFVEGRLVAVPPRALDLLIVLVRQAGALVPKETIFAQAWAGLIVEDSNLHVQVSTLRKILGPGVITTVSGHGYRFEAPISTVAREDRSLLPRHNLPRALTTFIGRESELTQCTQLLQQTRLLTLIGIGGSGKTRLAVELAESALPRFADGAWFVDLAPVLDSSRTALSVAAALGIGAPTTELVAITLCARLRSKQLLLVLDNCEHLLDSCAALIQKMLAAAPGLRILATSREALGIEGELVRAVGPLSVPETNPDSGVDLVLASDAVALFTARAMFVASHFTLDPLTINTVADICRRLDGIPLAIELAAAQSRLLSVEQIRLRLDDRFRLLVGAERALPRHQRLSTVIQWSYDHCSADQQRVLRHLSVFAGGWTLEAATAVVNMGAFTIEPVVELRKLVDKSLVTVDREWRDAPRYRMLETVREFLEQQLEAHGEADSARARYLAHFLDLAVTAAGDPRAGATLEILDTERENILLAHAWCDRVDGGAEQGIKLANAMHRHWMAQLATLDFRSTTLGHNPLSIGYRMTADALARPGLGRNQAVGQAHLNAGIYSDNLGARRDASGHFDQALNIAYATEDKTLTALALYYQAGPLCDDGHYAAAATCLEQARKLHEAAGDHRRAARVAMRQGSVLCSQGSLDFAEHATHAGMKLAAKLADVGLTMLGHVNLIRIALRRDAVANAARHLQDALSLPADGLTLADTPPPPLAMEMLPCVAAAAGELEACARYRGAADAHWVRKGLQRPPEQEAFYAPYITLARERLAPGAFDVAWTQGRALPLPVAADEGRAWLTCYLA